MSGAVPKLRFAGFEGAWETRPIKSRLEKIIDYRGKAPPKAETGIPLITARNVRMGYIDFTTDEYIEASLFETWMNRGKAREGDVLFTTEAPLGNVCMFPTEGQFALGQRIITLRADQAQLEGRFLYQFLLGEKGQNEVAFRSTGSTAKGIKSKVFVQIPFAAPSLPEQQKIAAFLGAVDAKLAGLARKEAALVRFKTGLMQKLFSQTLRFTRDDGSAFPDWEERPLSSVLHEHKEKSQGDEPVFSVSVHKGLVDQIEHLGRSFSAADTGHYNRVQHGDVVYTKSPTGKFPMGIIKQSTAGRPVIVSPLYGVFTPETESLGFILNAYFESNVNTANYLSPLVQKGAKNTIAVTNSRFLEGLLKLPRDPEEQQKIAAALSALDAKINTVAAQTQKIKAFKKGLLQQMFV